MARRKLTRPYTGILAQRPPKLLLGPTMTLNEAWQPFAEARKGALFDHFGIKHNHPNKWQILAFLLAQAHVPAFSPPHKPGRIAGNDPADATLLRELAMAEAAGLPVRWKAKHLAKGDAKKRNALLRQYYRKRVK
jgi:hypothetical protein